MENFFETVLRLDANDDHSGFLHFVQSKRHDSQEMLDAVWELLSKARWHSAFILAMILADAGIQHPTIAMALSVGGLVHNRPEEERRGLESLRTQMDRLSAERQTAFQSHIVAPMIIRLLEPAIAQSDRDQVLRILEILNAAVPRLRTISFTKESFLETVLRLDASDDRSEFLHFIGNEQHNPQEMLDAIRDLLIKARWRPAFILAMMLTNAGIQHPTIAMALSVGGMFYNNQEEERRGLESLRTQAGRLSDEQRIAFLHLIPPVITHLLGPILTKPDHDDQVLRILEILKAADPCLRTIFDWDAPVPELSLEKLRQQDRKQAKIVTFPLPPAGVPRQRRRVLVTARETFFHRPNSRLLDIGPRLTTAMNAYGWQAEYHAIKNSINECQIITEICRQKKPEVLILDEEVLLGLKHLRTRMITQLRQDNPSLKVVGYLLDAWNGTPTILKEAFSLLDLVWEAVVPSLPLWKDPTLANKMLFSPFPSAVNFASPEKPLIPKMLFFGGVKGYNWHRAFWLSAVNHLKLPIEKKLSTHAPDGLPALESYARYMQSLTEATCCLNFSMRPDHNHTRIKTGRSFETILSGSLLVQELAPDLHYAFTPGKHYLEFSTLAELSAIARFITEHREEAEEIRRCGHAFAREYYNDERLIGHLDKALYFS